MKNNYLPSLQRELVGYGTDEAPLTPEQIFEKLAEQMFPLVDHPEYEYTLQREAFIAACRLLWPLIDQWVPVSERLPEKTEPTMCWNDETGQREVLIENNHAIVLAYNPELGIYKAKYDRTGWWEKCIRVLLAVKEIIPTHWRPLPPAPGDYSQLLELLKPEP